MRFTHLLLALTSIQACLAAIPGTVRVQDWSGSAQPQRPITISRVFVEGEIQNFAQPRLAGASLPAWQCDVKSRWPNGTLKHALVSFYVDLPARNAANAAQQIDFVNSTAPSSSPGSAGMTAAQMEAFRETARGARNGWNARMDLYRDIQTRSAEARTDRTNRARVADARAMLAAGNWRYWLQGPVVTQVIVEDRTPALRYDMGWDVHKPLHPIFVLTFYDNWPGVKVEYILENAWLDKREDVSYSYEFRIGPTLGRTAFRREPFNHYASSRFRKVAWDGAAPGRIRLDLNSAYMAYSRAIPNYDFSCQVSAKAQQLEIADFNESDRGAELGDHAQMALAFGTTGGPPYVGLLPRWQVRYLYTWNPDLFDVMMANAEVSGYVDIHYRDGKNLGRKFCSVECAGANDSPDAFGEPVSIDAHPQVWENYEFNSEHVDANDRYPAVGKVSSGPWAHDIAHQQEFAYLPYLVTGDWYFWEELLFWAEHNFVHLPPSKSYGADGRGYDWGFLNAQAIEPRGLGWAWRTLANAAFIAPDGAQQRYLLAKIRNNAAVLEGVYDVRGGNFPPAGRNYECPNFDAEATRDKWCWGRLYAGEGRSNPLALVQVNGDTCGAMNPGCRYPSSDESYLNANVVAGADAPWQWNYVRLGIGRAWEMGVAPDLLPVHRRLSSGLVALLCDAAFNHWFLNYYRIPVLDGRRLLRPGVYDFFQTTADMMQGFTAGARAAYSKGPWSYEGDGTRYDGGDYLAHMDHGYTHSLRASASLLPGAGASFTGPSSCGGTDGEAAWKWMLANEPFKALYGTNNTTCIDPASGRPLDVATCDNPKWALVPRR